MAEEVTTTRLNYERPVVVDHGDLTDLTAGCVGGVPADSHVGADTQSFPADSGIFCQ